MERQDVISQVQKVPSSEYNCLVRVKTSITLPSDLLKIIDRADSNRSAFLEKAARAYLARLQKAQREAQDVAIINANADRLNQEALDVLDYQGLPRGAASFTWSRSPAHAIQSGSACLSW